MNKQTITVNAEPKVIIQTVHGDLRVAGWDRSELMAKTDGDKLELTPEGDTVTISCDEDLILYLPRNANLQAEKITGDVSLQAISGPVTLGPVSGDLNLNDLGPIMLGKVAGDTSLRNVGAVNVDSISGDFTLRGGRGACAAGTIGGDVSIRDVDGMVTIENVGSDLYVRNVHGGVNATAGADVALYLDPLPGQAYDVTAGADLILRLSPETNAKLHLSVSDSDSIQVDFPGVELPEDCTECDVTIGEERDEMAVMMLTASGDLLVTSQADPWESAADFGIGMSDTTEWPLPPDFSERINRRVQAAMERHQSHLEEISRRAEHTSQRASVKIEAAMRRAEAKARAAEVRSRRGQVNVNVGRWKWELAPGTPEPGNPPVSDEERLAILKMLQDKKITVDEAEKLLAALEGK